MAYTIFDPYANASRVVRNKSSAKRAAIDTAVIPAANTSQSNPYTAILINAGDILYITANTPNGLASLNTPGSSKANTAAHCGVAETGYPLRERQGVYVTSVDAVNDPPEVTYLVGGQFRFRTTAADVYTPGAAVYLGVDAQTVTVVSTSNGTALGTVAFDQQAVFGHPEVGNTVTGVAGGPGVTGGEVVIEYKPAVVA